MTACTGGSGSERPGAQNTNRDKQEERSARGGIRRNRATHARRTCRPTGSRHELPSQVAAESGTGHGPLIEKSLRKRVAVLVADVGHWNRGDSGLSDFACR